MSAVSCVLFFTLGNFTFRTYVYDYYNIFQHAFKAFCRNGMFFTSDLQAIILRTWLPRQYKS